MINNALLSVAQEAVEIATEIIMNRGAKEVHEKEERDFVSDVDILVERRVQEHLARSTPSIEFVGEEHYSGVPFSTSRTWVLDPLDGTSNFLHSIPLFGVSLGLVQDGRPIIGVIALPYLGEVYYAHEGLGAFCGNRRIAISRVARLSRAVVSIGDYAVGSGAEDKNQHRLALTHRLAPKVERLRMFGSAAVDLAWLAAGRTNASISLGNKAWDMAAGVIIAREAGAEVFDFDGSPHTIDSRITAATSTELADQIKEIVASVFDGDTK